MVCYFSSLIQSRYEPQLEFLIKMLDFTEMLKLKLQKTSPKIFTTLGSEQIIDSQPEVHVTQRKLVSTVIKEILV